MSGSGIGSDGIVGRGLLSPDQWRQVGEALNLSRRELQIIQCMFDDPSEESIARCLGTSRHTVHKQITRLFRKLDVNTKCELVIRVFAEHIRISDRQPAPVPPRTDVT